MVYSGGIFPRIKSQAVWWPLDVSSPLFGKLVALASSSNALVPYSNALVPYVMRGAGSILLMNQMKFRGTYSEMGAFLAGPISPHKLVDGHKKVFGRHT